MKFISKHDDWGKVSGELEKENAKLASYDNALISDAGPMEGKMVLDYGCGPGVMASAISRLGGIVRAFDISDGMRQRCGQKIGKNSVYPDASHIPRNSFDVVICNLVMCIVSEDEVRNISRNIRNALNKNGYAYVGFCNPMIYDVPESSLDFRYPTGEDYSKNHVYKKMKKEGRYEILEFHRPIGWYQEVFKDAGLEVADMLFTPEYEINGRKIRDFVIFRLAKAA